MYLETPLQHYLDDLASDRPTPGGGSAAAVSGAMAASLVSMVTRLTLGKAEYAAVQDEIGQILQQTEQLRARFMQLMQADIDAYGQLSACFKLPRATDEEKNARTAAIQAQLVEAAQVPLEMVEAAQVVAQLCLRVAEIGNKNVLSDIATATMLAVGAGNGAAWMVLTNLRALKDKARVEVLTERLHTALDKTTVLSQQVVMKVGERQ
jgi:formiminotetrahydrofolate cyclodeaminase